MAKFNPYQFIQEKIEIRPFNENAEKDGNWMFIHEVHVWTLIDRLRAEIARSKESQFARFADGECWIYQGDGYDYLESLTCPVVISAEKLIELSRRQATPVDPLNDTGEEIND